MKKSVYLFPGQGSQYVGMGKNLLDHAEVRQLYSAASDVIGLDLIDLCLNSTLDTLTQTANAQPAILVSSLAALKVFEDLFDESPSFAAGHSLGEISALTAVGAIEFTDAVKIVRKRGLLMQSAAQTSDGKMVAIANAAVDDVAKICLECSNDADKVVISNINSAHQMVISGTTSAVDLACSALKKLGVALIPLKVSAPFHSPYMINAAKEFEQELKQYTLQDFKYPVISNVDGVPYTDKTQIIGRLVEQMVKPVQWRATMAYLDQEDVSLAVEFGPKSVLKGLAKDNKTNCSCYSFDLQEDRGKLSEIFASSTRAITSDMSLIGKCLSIAVCTQNHNWDDEQYKRGVIEPYRKIQELQEELETNKMEFKEDHISQALSMLRSVFETKKTSPEERQARIDEIRAHSGKDYSYIFG